MKRFIGREREYSAVLAALEDPLPQAIFIWGPPSTGKTMILDAVIQECRIPYVARISGIEIMCGRRPFMETLLRQLTNEGDKQNAKCENLRSFIQNVREIFSRPDRTDADDGGKTVIIVDEAEYLREKHPDILNVLVKIQELTQGNICTVISSVVPSIGYTGIQSMRNVPTIHFQQYSKEEIMNIITMGYKPESADLIFFSAYVDMVLNFFFQACRDLKTLLRMTLQNWDYVQDSFQENTSILRIWKDIVPLLKQDFKTLNSQFIPMNENVPNGHNSGGTPAAAPLSANNSSGSKKFSDMPRHSKYIVIASYLATHNPPSSDKRFFVKGALRKGRKKSNRNVGAAPVEASENRERTKALRSFDQHRLKSIFAYLVTYCSSSEESYEGNVDWMLQISSLCQAQFMQNLGEDSAGNIKYRCLSDFDFVFELAKSVNFELDKHLHRLL